VQFVKQGPFKPVQVSVSMKLITLLCERLLLLNVIAYIFEEKLHRIDWRMWKARGSSCFGWIFIVALMGVTTMVITICNVLPDTFGVPNFYFIVVFFLLRLFYSVYRQEMRKKKLIDKRKKQREAMLAKRAKRQLWWQQRGSLKIVLS
jgi:uncharacterized membrane protein